MQNTFRKPYINGPLILIAGLLLGLAAAFLISGNELLLLAPLLVALPAALLFLRYPYIAAVLWVVLFPFFVIITSQGARYMYWVIHRGIVPLALGVAFIAHWITPRERRPVRIGPVELAMALFLLYSLANIFLLTQDPADTLIRYYDRIFIPFALYWLIRLTQPTPGNLKLLVPVALFTILFQGAVGLASWFAPSLLPGQWLNRLGERTTGTLANPGVFSTTMVFMGLILFQYALEVKSRLARVILFGFVAAAFFFVFFTFSRGSWLGGALAGLGLLIIYPRVTFKFALGAAVFIILTVALLFPSFYPYAQERLFTESTAQGRVVGAAATLGVIRSSPYVGVGFGQHELYDEQYRQRVLGFAVSAEHTSHHTYLLLTSEMGILGIGLYFLPVLYLLWHSLRNWRKMPANGWRSWRFLGLLWLVLIDHFVVGNFTDMLQTNFYNTGMWWLTLGLIANIVYPYILKADPYIPEE